MLTHPTLEKLQALRLTGMLKALSEQMQMPDIGQLNFEERLGLLVDREAVDLHFNELYVIHHSCQMRKSGPNSCDQLFSGVVRGVLAPQDRMVVIGVEVRF